MMSVTNLKSCFLESYRVMKPHADPGEAAVMLEMVEEIRALKRQKNAVILSHFYMAPELQVKHTDGGIADFGGDSLGLSVAASILTACLNRIQSIGGHFIQSAPALV